MEFKITSDLSVIKGQAITANFDEVSAWLDEELKPYSGMVVTADMIPTAKTYRANLRKVKDRIEQYRKEAKNAALAPYNAFEAQCKTLTGKLDAAADNIDIQVKEFEQAEREAKIADLKAFYDSSVGEIADYCRWETIFNERWSNKGYAPDTAKAEITSALDNTAKDLETIRGIGGENTAYLLDFYKTHDLSATVRKNQELIAMKAAEEQRRREAEERKEREAREDTERIAAEIERLRGAVKIAEKAEEPADPEESPAVHVIDFRVWATQEQLSALKSFLIQSGIRYGKAV